MPGYRLEITRTPASRPAGQELGGTHKMRSTLETMDVDAMFDSFNIEELDTMEIADGVALPEMAASSLPHTCCSSSSSSCCCC